MKSIRWIKQVLIDGKPAQFEIMMGVRNIADRCYVRVNQEPEIWFTPASAQRQHILFEGLATLQNILAGHTITQPDGSPFNWDQP